LGADGHSIRLALFTVIPCPVGPAEALERSVFVAPLPPGIDVILGTPWLRNSNVAISTEKMFLVPDGPSEDIYDLSTGEFAPSPQRNFDDLGFVKTPKDQTRFFFCALAAGVPGLEDSVDYESPNPFLDAWEDDPSKPDLTEEEARDRLEKLKSRFPFLFVDDLPSRLPPFRTINHEIHEVVEGMKIPPRVIRMPDKFRKK
jgi:hypothetical protein